MVQIFAGTVFASPHMAAVGLPEERGAYEDNDKILDARSAFKLRPLPVHVAGDRSG